MKHKLAALVAASAFQLLVSAESIPQGAVHQSAWGNAVVINQCPQPAYYILDNQPSKSSIQPSASMSIPLYTKAADGGGGSIKLFTDSNADLYAKPAAACTQFEFTPTGDKVFVDVSNVNSDNGGGKNGNGEPCTQTPPFMKGGLRLSVPSVNDIICEPGKNPCKTVYSKSDDDFATVATAVGNDVKLYLCPGGGSSGGSSGGSGGGSSGGSSGGGSTQSPQNQQVQHPAQQAQAQAQGGQQQSHSQTENDDVTTVAQYVQAPAQTVFKYVYANANGNGQGQHQKREEHIHQHAHNKIHKRRLGV